MNKVITRFAPSPTGSLHIGGARTAMFNWLYAKKYCGIFKLRVEDTDKARSKNIYTEEICEALEWLGINWDGEIEYQSNNLKYHTELANKLLSFGKAYKCYCTKEEIEIERNLAYKNKRPYRYSGKCRNLKKMITDKPFVVRVKSPKDGISILNDEILGSISVKNQTIEDFIILRADKTPTYMLSVVADDFRMKITDVIRGDDHLTNTFKQMLLYDLLEWKLPKFSHIPLIHGTDGNKLSKRHGGLNLLHYKKERYLPEALNNYLLRLGWGYKDKEIFTIEEAKKLFNIKGIGKSPARFDQKKLTFLNSYYIRNMKWSLLSSKIKLTNLKQNIINVPFKIVQLFQQRAESLKDLESGLKYMLEDNFTCSSEAKDLIDNAKLYLIEIAINKLEEIKIWKSETINLLIKDLAKKEKVKIFEIAAPIRASLTGQKFTPDIFTIIEFLGKEKVIYRLKKSFCK